METITVLLHQGCAGLILAYVTYCLVNGGPASQKACQHSTYIGSTSPIFVTLLPSFEQHIYIFFNYYAKICSACLKVDGGHYSYIVIKSFV